MQSQWKHNHCIKLELQPTPLEWLQMQSQTFLLSKAFWKSSMLPAWTSFVCTGKQVLGSSCRDSTFASCFSLRLANLLAPPLWTLKTNTTAHCKTRSQQRFIRFVQKVILRTQKSFVRFPRRSYKPTSNYQPSHRSRPSLYHRLVFEIANRNGTTRSWKFSNNGRSETSTHEQWQRKA